MPVSPALPPRPKPTDPRALESVLLVVMAVLALIYLRSTGTSDMADFWLKFYEQMKGYNLIEGYERTALDYPPFSHALIYLSGQAAEAMGATPLIGIKVCLLLFTVVSTILFRWLWGNGLPLLMFAAGGLINAVMLGYLDIMYAPPLLLALWALERRRIALFGVLYAVCCYTKWQPLIFAPFCAWYALRPPGASPQDGLALSWRRAAWLVLPALAAVAVVLAVYGKPVVEAFQAAVGDSFLSGKTLNVNWVVTYLLEAWHPGNIPPLNQGEAEIIPDSLLGKWMWLPRGVFIGAYLLALWRFHRGPNTFPEFVRASMMGFLIYCMFNTGVHENHFYIATVLAAVLASRDARATVQALLVTAMGVLNIVQFYGFNGAGLKFSRIILIDLSFVLAVAYSGLFFWWWIAWMRRVDPVPDANRVSPGSERAEAG